MSVDLQFFKVENFVFVRVSCIRMKSVNNRNMSVYFVNTHHAAKTKYVRNRTYTPEISKAGDVGWCFTPAAER